MATKKAAGTEEKETGDSPLIDMNNREVKRMIKLAKERGFVTYDALNAVLPPEEFSSEQIEDVMAMLSQMGINVVENDDSEENEEDSAVKAANDDEGESNSTTTAVAKTARTTGTGDRPDDPVRMYLREMGSGE